MNKKGGAPTDRLFAEPVLSERAFEFDQRVAEVFPDMINRSVPGYSAIMGMIEILAAEYAGSNSNLYDLGCSLGAAAAAMQSGTARDGVRIVAVDNAPAMLDRARQICDARRAPKIEFHCRSIQQQAIENASMVVLNFTLQFIPLEERLPLLRGIRVGMLPEGVLILSEKIKGKDAQEDELLVEMHHAFKRANGYSQLEISRKRNALENVLLPETIEIHRMRLRQAGFSRVDLWFQCFNFVSMVARP